MKITKKNKGFGQKKKLNLNMDTIRVVANTIPTSIDQFLSWNQWWP